MSEHKHFDRERRNELILHGELLPQPLLPDTEGNIAVYNPSSLLTISSEGGEAAYVWARVEPDTATSYINHTDVRLFRLRSEKGSNELEPVLDAPILHGEDPSFVKIGDEYFVGIVELEEDTHDPTTVFYSYDPETHACVERFRGPKGQKDVRLAAVDPADLSKGLVVYGRPDFGNDRRRITRVFLSGIDDPEIEQKLAGLTREESVIGEELFQPFIDEQGVAHHSWGGINYVSHIVSESGETFRVLGAHLAYFTDHDEPITGEHRPRHYEGMLLLDIGETLVKICVFGSRDDFPDADPKMGREDLRDVCFLGGGSDGMLEGRWLYGLGDSRIGMVTIDAASAQRLRDLVSDILRQQS